MLVAPRKHVGTIYELNMAEQKAIWELVGEVRERLLIGLKPDGFHIGFEDALAGLNGVAHAHVHIVPRANGDPPDPRDSPGVIVASAHWRK